MPGFILYMLLQSGSQKVDSGLKCLWPIPKLNDAKTTLEHTEHLTINEIIFLLDEQVLGKCSTYGWGPFGIFQSVK